MPATFRNPNSKLSEIRVLIVDDQPGIRTCLSSILMEEGYLVEAVGSGEIALSLLRAVRFDILLLDISLPGMSGLEVLRHLGTFDQLPSVIVMSANTNLYRLHHNPLFPGVRWLEKPLCINELRLAIRDAQHDNSKHIFANARQLD